MSAFYLLILALAVSLDSFGVGITYGLRKIKIPMLSILIISIASAIMILISMQIGLLFSNILSPFIAKLLGSLILIVVGVLAILNVLRTKNGIPELENKNENNTGKRIILIEIKKLGLVIQILKTPLKADIDKSGVISSIEAMFLGIALSLDAFGAGLGAALLGFNPLLTSFTIATMSGIFILLGIRLGFLFSDTKWMKKFSIIPGIILITIGIMRIL